MLPLQDITDRVLPNKRPRRGALRRTRTIPSSLPPSSPPSASSHSPEPKLDDIFTNNDQLSSLPILSSDDELSRVTKKDDKLNIIQSDENADTSDPFGFFALEKKLKARLPQHSIALTIT